MTWSEFGTWLEHHCEHYTRLEAWLTKEPSRDKVLAAWFKLLADVELDAAKLASEALFQSAEADQPRSFDSHPRAVRQLALGHQRARLPRASYVDGQAAVCCRQCDDTGLVRVWSGKSVAHVVKVLRGGVDEAWQPHQAFDDGAGGRQGIYFADAACECRAGHLRRQQGHRLFDAAIDPRVTKTNTADAISELVCFVEAKLAGEKPRQLEAFA